MIRFAIIAFATSVLVSCAPPFVPPCDAAQVVGRIEYLVVEYEKAVASGELESYRSIQSKEEKVLRNKELIRQIGSCVGYEAATKKEDPFFYNIGPDVLMFVSSLDYEPSDAAYKHLTSEIDLAAKRIRHRLEQFPEDYLQ